MAFYTLQVKGNDRAPSGFRRWVRVESAPLFTSPIQAYRWLAENNGMELASYGWRVRPATALEIEARA